MSNAFKILSFLSVLAAFTSFGGCSCGDNAGTGDGGSGMDATSDGWVPTTDGPVRRADGGVTVTQPDGGAWTCYPTSCAGHVLECGDCEDNDGDGFFDSRDRECLGPCDNTEGPELLAGVGGETGGPCKADCYFDFGNGPGNDDCFWDHRCDPLSVGPTYDPEGPTCEYEADRVGSRDCPAAQSDTCGTVCSPLTPNGCDCFGCCTFDDIRGRSAANGGEYVWIGSVAEGTNDGTCNFDDVTDTTACRPCTPVGDCLNECGECELCIGRATLPASCYEVDAGVPYRCAEGQQECGLPGDSECGLDYYCVTGCCVQTII